MSNRVIHQDRCKARPGLGQPAGKKQTEHEYLLLRVAEVVRWLHLLTFPPHHDTYLVSFSVQTNVPESVDSAKSFLDQCSERSERFDMIGDSM